MIAYFVYNYTTYVPSFHYTDLMPPKFKINRGGGRGGFGGGGRGGGSWRGTSRTPYKDNTKGSTAGAAGTSAHSTGRTLIIVESPAKCQKIEGYLGKDKYMCLASFGHIREIEDGLKSIDIDHEFKTKFAIMSSKQGQVAKLRAAIAAADEVILATDDDREGEAIAWHLCQVFNLSVETTKRIIFHEITESALKAAVADPRTINMSLVHAQQARQILDLIVGYKISPVLWTYVAHTNLSAGRCQTPALRLIHDNYKELEASAASTVMVYSVSGIFTKLNLTFHLSRDLESTEVLERFIQETAAAPDTAFRAKVGASKKVTKAPPRPYSTSTLQQAASNDLHLSPKDTMFVAQKLYEGGYITYMRTDSKVYSAEFVAKACGYIRGRWGGAGGASVGSDNDLIGNISSVTGGAGASGGGTEAAHEAIRPTDISRTLLPQSCHPREHRLYSIILRNTLESLMAPAICQTITMSIPSPVLVPVAGAGDAVAEYRHTAEQVIKPGWKLVAGYEADDAEYTYFASFAASASAQPMPYKKITTKCSMRNTKSHYTESGLVQLLEKMGIGRPSTFSSLIDKIQERGYVKLQDVRGKSLECREYTITGGGVDVAGGRKIESKIEVREIGGETRKLVIQPLGIIVIEFLLEHFAPLFEYEFTKNMEFQLDEIATDGMVWHELCYKCWFDVTTQLQELKERGVVKEEIKIDDRHSYILSKHGPVIRCRVTDDDDAGSDSVSIAIHSSDDDDDDAECVSETIHTTAKEKKPKFIFKPVRQDLDYAKILRGEYSLAYMIGEENATGEVTTVVASGGGGTTSSSTTSGRVLGQHQGQDVVIKSGKYGAYVAWGGGNISLKPLLGISSSKAGKYARKETKQTKSEFDLTLQEVVAFINSSRGVATVSAAAPESELGDGGGDGGGSVAAAGIVRRIDEHTSIRNGRFGPYIFYKTVKMSKPEFIPLKGFAELHGNYATCDVSLLKEWVARPRKK